METKQVIIQNKDEERQFLEEATERGWKWVNCDEKPTKYVPSDNKYFWRFSYVIKIVGDKIGITDYPVKNPLTVQQFIESK